MIPHDHDDDHYTYTQRQPLIDHMITTHQISPTHFRDKTTFESVEAVHVNQHARSAWDHPQHYGGADNPYEAIKVIMAWGLGFNLGNAVKYISRAGKKDPAKTIEDLKKARWYLDYEIRRLDEAGAAAAHDIGG